MLISSAALDKGGEAQSFIGVKRESSIPEPNMESEGPPNKRVKTTEGNGAKSLEVNANTLFRKFVTSALDERAIGNTVNFELLRKKFSSDPEDEPSSLELQNTILALTHTVSRLNGPCWPLVKDIINFRWVARDGGFVTAYVRLLGHLASAHSNYMDTIIKMLVRHLSFSRSSASRLPSLQPVRREVIYDRVHFALEFILYLVPTAAFSTLFPALVMEFPHKSEKRMAHVTYIANLLRIIEYAPSLRSKLLAVITDRVIKVDTEIQADLDELEDSQGDELEAEIGNTGAGDPKAGAAAADGEDSDSEEDSGEEDMDAVTSIKDTVDKLDSMLEILLSYYSKSFPTKSTTNPSTQSIETFEVLLRLFNTTILPTYRSRYTQFLLFWAAQKSPRFSDQFCVNLLDKALDNSFQSGTRQAAASYIASFVARAKFMPANYVQTVVKIMCRWLGAFVDQRSIECQGPDVVKWGGFYSVCQAVMYIFCFRWRDLKEVEEDEFGLVEERWVEELEILNKVVTSRFNPLKVCSPAVVETFAKISNHLQFLFCYTIIEQNKRKGLMGQGELDSYFPFDPYNLKRSKHWIQDCYIEWQPVEGLEDDDEEEDSADESGNGSETEEEIEDDSSGIHG